MQEPNQHIVRDPLLEALVAMTRLHHQPHSAESLTAGLPLEDGRLTTPLFIRAAASVGFNASYVQRQLTDITPLILPVVLEMKGDQAAILVERNGDVATVLFLDEQEKTHEIEITSLEERYAGNCYLLKPGMAVEGISKDWFWSTIRKSRGLYAEVLVASLLINLFALIKNPLSQKVQNRSSSQKCLWASLIRPVARQ